MFDPGRDAALTSLPPRPASARTARRFVASALRAWALADLAETTELLTGELVSNVVLHAGCAFELRVCRCGETSSAGVRVEVSDSDPAQPRLRDGAAESPDGRGLMLVDALASAWGVEPTDRGKVVWFEVAA